MRSRTFSIFRAPMVVVCEGAQASNHNSNDSVGSSTHSPFSSNRRSSVPVPALDLSSKTNPYTFRRRRLTNVRPRGRRSSHRKASNVSSDQDPPQLVSIYASELDPFSKSLRSENEPFSYISKVLGIFSCSGLEPVLLVDEDENGKEIARISTTRKINQDRGCTTVDVSNRQALFGVYDGKMVALSDWCKILLLKLVLFIIIDNLFCRSRRNGR